MQSDELKGSVPYPADRRKPAVEHTVVDFTRLLEFLKSRGYGVNAIALYANLSRTAVRNYFDGTTPLHPQGERLIRFWCEIAGSNREAVPTKRDLATISTSRS